MKSEKTFKMLKHDIRIEFGTLRALLEQGKFGAAEYSVKALNTLLSLYCRCLGLINTSGDGYTLHICLSVRLLRGVSSYELIDLYKI